MRAGHVLGREKFPGAWGAGRCGSPAPGGWAKTGRLPLGMPPGRWAGLEGAPLCAVGPGRQPSGASAPGLRSELLSQERPGGRAPAGQRCLTPLRDGQRGGPGGSSGALLRGHPGGRRTERGTRGPVCFRVSAAGAGLGLGVGGSSVGAGGGTRCRRRFGPGACSHCGGSWLGARVWFEISATGPGLPAALAARSWDKHRKVGRAARAHKEPSVTGRGVRGWFVLGPGVPGSGRQRAPRGAQPRPGRPRSQRVSPVCPRPCACLSFLVCRMGHRGPHRCGDEAGVICGPLFILGPDCLGLNPAKHFLAV